MDYKEVNAKIETLKNSLVCACLIVVLMTSCNDSRRNSELLNDIVRLQMVNEQCEKSENSLNIHSDECENGVCPVHTNNSEYTDINDML